MRLLHSTLFSKCFAVLSVALAALAKLYSPADEALAPVRLLFVFSYMLLSLL